MRVSRRTRSGHGRRRSTSSRRPRSPPMTAERRARALLALGAGTGLALAVASLLGGGRTARSLPPDAVAIVDGVTIGRDDYARTLAGLASDRRAPPTDAERRRVLDRLIDEELLLQRGIELGLVRRDRTVRGPLVAATIDLLGHAPAEPTAAELAAYYDAHRDWFTRPGRLRVRQVFVRAPAPEDDAPASARAAEAARRLRAGEDFVAVRTALGDDEVAPVPDALLPPAKLREYVGDTVTRTAIDLGPGATSDAVRSGTGYHVVQVVEREAPAVPPFEEIQGEVRAEVRRRGDEAALRAALDRLRADADVLATDVLP